MGKQGGPDPVDVHVGSRIKMQRRIAGISQTELGKAIGVTFQQVQKYEKGTNRVSSGKLQQIARLLKVPISLFFGETGGPKGKTGEPDYLVVLCNTPGGLQLARAFSRIKSKRLRASIVKLVELAAKT